MEVETSSELLRSLLRSTVQENSDDLQWAGLEITEKRSCLSSGRFDIDFAAFSGLSEELLNEPAIAGMLSNLSGTFVKYPYVQRLHGYRLQKVLVLCDMKPFKLALSLNEAAEEDDEKFENCESEENEKASSNAGYLKNVADLIADDKGRTFPYREMKSKICSVFQGFELICYQFGQKQRMEDFVAQVKNVASTVKIGVAVGLELFLKDYILLVTPEHISIGECFYSMFLSQQAGSILCTSKQAEKLLKNSHR